MALPQTGNITANGNFEIDGMPSGQGNLPNFFAIWGGGGSNFGAGTFKLQAGYLYGPPNAILTQWIDVPSGSFTAAGQVNVAVRADKFRVNVAGATSPNVWFRFM